MSPLYIGIDPGATGAIALIDTDEGLVQVVDMPLVDAPKKPKATTKTRRTRKKKQPAAMVCGRRLASMLRWLPASETVVAIEKVNAMPRRGKNGKTVSMGTSSMFNFGNSAGVARGVVEALDLKLRFVTPQEWKKFHGLIGTLKDESRVLALRKYPALTSDLKRKKDGGRADALLIAEYLASKTVH